MAETFKPVAKKAVELQEITIALLPDHVAKLATIGKAKGLTPEEVLAQFIPWCLESGLLGRQKKAKKAQE